MSDFGGRRSEVGEYDERSHEISRLYFQSKSYQRRIKGVCRWQACLVALPDLDYQENPHQPVYREVHYAGEWHPVRDGATAESIGLSLPITVSPGNFSLLLVVGMGFGTIRSGGAEAVKYAGCGKVVKGM